MENIPKFLKLYQEQDFKPSSEWMAEADPEEIEEYIQDKEDSFLEDQALEMNGLILPIRETFGGDSNGNLFFESEMITFLKKCILEHDQN